jgi:DNA-binding PadR family transcriptional regulator
MNRNKKFAFNVQLAILGFLREKEFYGYELKKVMEKFMGPWTNIKFGSIYYALEKLDQDGMLAQVREEKEGAQPARTVYRITDKGRAAFDEMLLESFDAFQQMFFLLDVALFFSGGLDRQFVAGKLRERAEKTQQVFDMMEALRTTHTGNEIAQALIRHSQMHLSTERDFLLDTAATFSDRDPFAERRISDWMSSSPRHAVTEEVETKK